MPLVVQAQIESLLNIANTDALVMSCYADLAVHDSIKRHWREEIRHQASHLRRHYSNDEALAKEFDQNLKAVEQGLDSIDVNGLKGMGVFSVKKQGILQLCPLSLPITTSVTVAHEPYLVPLLTAYFAQQERYLVATINLRHAELFNCWLGGKTLLKEWLSEVPSKRHATGDRGGWLNSKVAQHREEFIERYIKEIAETMEKWLQQHPNTPILLLGQHQNTQRLVKELPASLQKQVVAERPVHEPHSATAIDAQIHAMMTEAHELKKKRMLEELENRRDQAVGASCGLDEVLTSLDAGRVEKEGTILFGPDHKENCWCCPSCRTIALEQGPCPRCISPLREANLWEELMVRAMRHNWKVMTFPSADMESCGGLALLFDRADQRLPETQAVLACH